MKIEKPDPSKEAEKEQAPGEEVLHQNVLEALKNLSPDQLVTINPDTEVVKGKAYRSAAWLHGPAHLELLAMADKRLTKVANQGGNSINRVVKVKSYLVKGTKLLILKAAPADDLTAIPVNRYAGASSAWINLIDLLAQEGLTVDSNWKELYEVAFIPKSSPLWPGLLVDLSQKKDRRTIKKENAE